MLTLKPDFVWTEEGLRAGLDVTVHADRIVGLGPVGRQPEDGRGDVVALPGRILVPGLVDVVLNIVENGPPGMGFGITALGQVPASASAQSKLLDLTGRMPT